MGGGKHKVLWEYRRAAPNPGRGGRGESGHLRGGKKPSSRNGNVCLPTIHDNFKELRILVQLKHKICGRLGKGYVERRD